MPLKRNSDPVDYVAMLADSNADITSDYLPDIGSTTNPEALVEPHYEINCIPAGNQFRTEVVIKPRADQGTNTSIHLKAGVFETNGTLRVDEWKANQKKKKPLRISNFVSPFEVKSLNRVYFYMPEDMAKLNRKAEVEHCDDLIYAYDETLGTLDTVLASIQPVTAPTQSEAAATIVAAIRTALDEVQRSHLGIDPKGWHEEYKRLCARTLHRDSERWHDFGLELVDANDVPSLGKPTYLTGARRDRADVQDYYLRFTKGTTEIGIHPTAEVIV